MNDKRRARLRDALKALNDAHAIVDTVCDQEQDCMDNYPENLQDTEKYERMEDAVDNLDEAMEKIDEAAERIRSAAEG